MLSLIKYIATNTNTDTNNTTITNNDNSLFVVAIKYKNP